MKKIILAAFVFVASCGGSTSSDVAVHRMLWEWLRGTCAVVQTIPPPPADTAGGDTADAGVPQ